MFLLHPDIFWWDLILLVLLSFTVSGMLVCEISCRRDAKRHFRNIAIRCIELVAFAGFALLVYGSFVEPYILMTTKIDVPFASDEPLRIAVIGDLHTGPYTHRGQMEQVVERVNQLLPDIILLTGDYILGDTSDLALLNPLKDLRATQGVYAVLGNHDSGFLLDFFMSDQHKGRDRREEITAKLESLGITVLRNSHTIIRTGDSTIAIAGIEDFWTGEENLATALDGIPEDMPTILLSHNPTIVLDPLANHADLIVSGHTHGGQIQLPWIGPLPTIPTKLGQNVASGLFPLPISANDHGATWGYLFVTRGVGESGPRTRLFAWPEVALLTTVPSK